VLITRSVSIPHEAGRAMKSDHFGVTDIVVALVYVYVCEMRHGVDPDNGVWGTRA
jgi:hypothetical protein